jgi:hypothetical protein
MPLPAESAAAGLGGDGLVARAHIAAEPGLEFAQAQILHLTLQVAGLDRERLQAVPDTECVTGLVCSGLR